MTGKRRLTEVSNDVRGRRLWLTASLCATYVLTLVYMGKIEKSKGMRKAGVLPLG
jgi:hypothetical protein